MVYIHTLDRPKRTDCRNTHHDDASLGLWYCGECKETVPIAQKERHLKGHIKSGKLFCRVCERCMATAEGCRCRFARGVGN